MTPEIIQALMEVKGINNIELARMTGLSVYGICKLRHRSTRVMISTVRKVAKALDVPPSLLTLKIKEE